jgi:MFS family permease
MTLILNFLVICIGRFLFGFASGVLLSIAPKLVEETVPARLLDYGYGVITNILINVAVMYSMILGFGVPSDDDVYDLEKTNFWRIIYGV